MLNPTDVQVALIAILKANAALTTALGGADEIREDEWPGPDWSYPCVRVALNTLFPTSPGKCHLTSWTVTFSIFVFTQPTVSAGTYTADSQQCMDLMNLVVDTLFGIRVESTGNFIAEAAANVTGQNAPVPEPPPGGWRGEVLYEMIVVEI